MCQSNDCCQKPEMLKDASGKCTTEQIRICQGDMENHPCTNGKQESEKTKE